MRLQKISGGTSNKPKVCLISRILGENEFLTVSLLFSKYLGFGRGKGNSTPYITGGVKYKGTPSPHEYLDNRSWCMSN